MTKNHAILHKVFEISESSFCFSFHLFFLFPFLHLFFFYFFFFLFFIFFFSIYFCSFSLFSIFLFLLFLFSFSLFSFSSSISSFISSFPPSFFFSFSLGGYCLHAAIWCLYPDNQDASFYFLISNLIIFVILAPCTVCSP